MKRLFTLTILVLGLLLEDANGNAMYRRLIKRIKNKLDPDFIPLGKDNEAVNISMSVSLIDITEANANKNQMEIEAWLTFTWNSGITWPKEKFNFRTVRVHASDIWTPDMDIYNGFKKIENQAPPLVVLNDDGKVVWMIKTRIEARCDISPKRLALNETCVFKIGSWTNSGLIVHLQEPQENVDLSNFEYSKYKVLDAKLTRHVVTYSCCPEPYETYKLSFSFAKKDRNGTSSDE